MKKIAYCLTLGLTALFLSSCCGFGGGGCGGKIVNVGAENECTSERTVIKYKTVTRMVGPSSKSGKGGIPYEVSEQVAYEVTEVVDNCGACGSTYCPNPGCCGTVSKAVLRRATAQNGTGEPHMGTIPTMKILAE